MDYSYYNVPSDYVNQPIAEPLSGSPNTPRRGELARNELPTHLVAAAGALPLLVGCGRLYDTDQCANGSVT
jgi:hypothetical protein